MALVFTAVVGCLPVESSDDSQNPNHAFVRAEWIAPPGDFSPEAPVPIFRRSFTLDAMPDSARIRVIGLGDYMLWINGNPVADTGINQAWSQYERTLFYREFDITKGLTVGKNVVADMLAHSFWDNRRS